MEYTIDAMVELYSGILQSNNPPNTLKNAVVNAAEKFVNSEDASAINDQLDSIPPSIRRCIYDAITKIKESRCDEDQIFGRLLEFIDASSLFENKQERAAALFALLFDSRLAYQPPTTITMDDGEFEERINNMRVEVAKIESVVAQAFPQRTEEGSAIIEIVRSVPNDRDRAVLAAVSIAQIERRSNP